MLRTIYYEHHKVSQIYFTINEVFPASTLQSPHSCVAQSFLTIGVTLLGRKLILEWVPFINHFRPSRELWEQQSSRHVYTASLQERTDGNTIENNPDMNLLSPGQKHYTFDIIKETVKGEGLLVFDRMFVRFGGKIFKYQSGLQE